MKWIHERTLIRKKHTQTHKIMLIRTNTHATKPCAWRKCAICAPPPSHLSCLYHSMFNIVINHFYPIWTQSDGFLAVNWVRFFSWHLLVGHWTICSVFCSQPTSGRSFWYTFLSNQIIRDLLQFAWMFVFVFLSLIFAMPDSFSLSFSISYLNFYVCLCLLIKLFFSIWALVCGSFFLSHVVFFFLHVHDVNIFNRVGQSVNKKMVWNLHYASFWVKKRHIGNEENNVKKPRTSDFRTPISKYMFVIVIFKIGYMVTKVEKWPYNRTSDIWSPKSKNDHITELRIYGQSDIWSPILRSQGVTIYPESTVIVRCI